MDRDVFGRVDYSLLITFVGFFVFIGNIGRMELFRTFLESVVNGFEVPVGILSSQIISNVPAALLLSEFTQDIQSLIVGVNLGGLGTLIASMASLISYKQIVKEMPEEKGTYFKRFTWTGIAFLAVLILIWWMIR
jgi:Na+/H+ antiporter NhaD/arsenite permease-like protein